MSTGLDPLQNRRDSEQLQVVVLPKLNPDFPFYHTPIDLEALGLLAPPPEVKSDNLPLP